MSVSIIPIHIPIILDNAKHGDGIDLQHVVMVVCSDDAQGGAAEHGIN